MPTDLYDTPFLMEADLSQVESRIVYMYTCDPELIAEARTRPWEYDMHTANAQLIFKVPEISKEQRYLGKRGVHGAQRGMEGFRLADILLNDDYIKTPEECQAIIDAYHTAKPAVKDKYFRWIQQQLWENRRLVNSWGREIHFPFDRWDKEVYKEAYSWIPQSENADLLNVNGVVPAFAYLRANGCRSRLLAQVHDSMLFETYLDEVWQLSWFIRGSLEQEREYPGGKLSVPVTFKAGMNWSFKYWTGQWVQDKKTGETVKETKEKEWKRLPEKGEYEEEIAEEILKTNHTGN